MVPSRMSEPTGGHQGENIPLRLLAMGPHSHACIPSLESVSLFTHSSRGLCQRGALATGQGGEE